MLQERLGMGCEMDTARELIRTKSFWVFIVVAILGGIEAVHSIPLLGLGIAVITILGISLQGVETVLTERRIEQARNEAATQHSVAMQEITQARGDAATQHTKALQEIEQARAEAATQHVNAMQKIKKAKEEYLLLIKWVPRLWFLIYSVSDKLVTPTVVKWLERRFRS